MAMKKIRETATVQAYDRQGAAIYLRAKLGGSFQWLKLLEGWSRDNVSGPLRGVVGLYLAPSYLLHGRTPLYAPESLNDFVARALTAGLGLGAEPLNPQAFDIDAEALRHKLPWRMRRVRRCTRKTTPSKVPA